MFVIRKKYIVMIMMLSVFFTYMMPMIPSNAEAENGYLEELINKEIITPYKNGDYRLDKGVTRAEYLTVLYKTVCVIDSYGIFEDREIEEKRVDSINNIKEI